MRRDCWAQTENGSVSWGASTHHECFLGQLMKEDPVDRFALGLNLLGDMPGDGSLRGQGPNPGRRHPPDPPRD